MKDEKCALVKELLPLYIEGITSQEATEIIEQHIKTCTLCREFYKKEQTNFSLDLDLVHADKETLGYINGIKLWYLLCPLIMLLFLCLEWSTFLRVYEGFLFLFAVCAIASEVFHKGTWWTLNVYKCKKKFGMMPRKKEENSILGQY
ncbi:hypothetical protein IMSAGC002_04622 [Lachnospiraceae bacterium]|nr:hypothetical protein IMSAGC002_04622 [Lachnospiraceae bacterium]